ncbi:hypothetical protein LTR86_009190 [Recurvomyces mirabilis]|nr:hypothetical protein LTR86_009190 [Recurvomyces mirabilis]
MASKTHYALVRADGDDPQAKGASISDKSEATHKKHRKNTLLRHWTDDWLQEYICVVLGAVFIVALAIVLLKQDGKPPPSFGAAFGGALTLNTVISIIAAAAKALLLLPVMECVGQLKWIWFLHRKRPLHDFSMFDQASRGLFGGLTLAWRTRLRSFAAIGSVVVILGIAIDPFTQQLVAYRTQHISTASMPDVPISSCWWDQLDNGPTGQAQAIQVGTNTTDCYSSSADSPARYNSISSGMKGAILQGLYSSNSTILDIAPQCPSGNCTINEYSSLAVCTSVVDVTARLANRTASGITNTYVSAHQYINASAGIMNVTSAATGTPYDSGDGWGPAKGYQLQFNDSIAFTQTPSPLADAFIMVANSTHSILPANVSDPNELFLQKYNAYEFMLEWCVQNYSTTVVNGISTTQRLGALRNFRAPDGPEANLNLSTTSYALGVPETLVFNIDQVTHYSVQKYLQGLLDGWISGGDDQCWTATSDAVLCLYEPFQLGPNTSPDRGDTLYDVFNQLSTNGTSSGVAGLEAVLKNVATSMSN